MNEGNFPIWAMLGTFIMLLFLALGLIMGGIRVSKENNKGQRYWQFYSVFCQWSVVGVFIGSTCFYVEYLDSSILLQASLLLFAICTLFVWFTKRASKGSKVSFILISIPPAFTLWLIPLTIWNVYYALKLVKPSTAT